MPEPVIPASTDAADVSVVSVCYNNLAGLKETWDSVRGQSCQEWEWVVIDGGSTDGTPEFLGAIGDARLRWVSEKDRGIYDAMNKGLERATGTYVTFLNSGDLFSDAEVLAEVVRAARSQGTPDLCYGDAYEKAPDGALLRKVALSHRQVWYGMFTHHQAMFYRRAFVGAQRYPTYYKIGGDYAFTAEILARGGRAYRLSRPLCIFEKGGLSERAAADGRADVWRVQKEVLRMPYPARLAVRAAHMSIYALKSLSPGVYRALRFRKSLGESPR